VEKGEPSIRHAEEEDGAAHEGGAVVAVTLRIMILLILL
jgi:hypothetical protein